MMHDLTASGNMQYVCFALQTSAVTHSCGHMALGHTLLPDVKTSLLTVLFRENCDHFFSFIQAL